MSNNFVEYNIESLDALIEQIKLDNPGLAIDKRYVEFGDMYADPTPAEPGRTFIEMTNLLTKHKDWYAYRRLDIALVPRMRTDMPLRVKTPITAQSIVNELNRARGMALSKIDLNLSTHLTEEQCSPFVYPLEILGTSPRYYGKINLNISPIVVNEQIMRMEDDTLMQEENGTFMLLENSPSCHTTL